MSCYVIRQCYTQLSKGKINVLKHFYEEKKQTNLPTKHQADGVRNKT